jgi:hypothetical protein
MNWRWLTVVLAFFATQACTCNSGNLGIRSGSVRDDNVEEPIPEQAKRFEPLLDLANEMTTLLRDGRLQEFYDKYTADTLKKQMSAAELEKIHAQVIGSAGKAISFKPRQWYFRAVKSETESYVVSQKIVQHERGSVYYAFSFANDQQKKIVGLHFRPRPATGPYPP